ncbi:MAG: hypothetical protein D6736_14745 [Nitrospinota bacterium]|nr:MAG: hypothetical protein D6736_14745 [Nitrospinota bacterium]
MGDRKPIDDMLPWRRLVRARRALAHAQGELREAEQILRYRQLELFLLEQELEEAEERADREQVRLLRTRKEILEGTLLSLAQQRRDKALAVEECERMIYRLKAEQERN